MNMYKNNKRFIQGFIVLISLLSGLGVAGSAIAADQPAQGGNGQTENSVFANFTPVTDEMIQNPDPADWLTWRRTLNAWGHSPLDQINTDNVDELRMVWVRGIGDGIQEGTALVHDGIMFFPNPLDVVQAIDIKSGDLLWEYRRRLPRDLEDYFPVPSINRNLAIYEDLIIDTSADDYIYALDAYTGELVWETQILDYRQGAQQTSGPIIANGMAISGRGCEPEGSPDACIMTAHNASTGEEIWRTRTIALPGEPNGESWGDMAADERWHVGTWLVPSYDPELNLVYFGTSVTSPAPKFMMAGNEYQYLYHNSTLALDADTGEMVWYYQHLVDHWDYDFPFERLLVDTAVAPDPDAVEWINPDIEPGEVRKVLTGIPGKPGFIYTLDRETGEFLWAKPVVYQNLIDDIDGRTGEVSLNPETLFTEVGQTVLTCGGEVRGWPSGTYSPTTNMMYYALHRGCGEVTSTMSEPSLDNLYGIAGFTSNLPLPDGTPTLNTVTAISAETGEVAWAYEQEELMMSLMSTDGGLIFGGDNNGRMKALDKRTGELLWEINVGSSVSGYPSTFMVDGKQYISFSTGLSLYAGAADANLLFVFALPD
ncbi:MAG: pyrrolo-quinoline quinone [Gammaproteobacteria bacterium]|nr:pyrrolo-quinoline quinone [Gammaproteobacteria bacterium]|tara:strand:+ start:118698 stop:120488 length:1791 start_codon:yes stop_codon:yes gene_type:complete